MELYQYFTSAEFKEKRRVAWRVMCMAISNPDYADFLIEGNFVSRYTNRIQKREKIYQHFKEKFYPNTNLNEDDFFQQESEDRHKLESIIDFFQLLAIRDVPNDNYKVCDFYYDNWRPLLCWYARKMEKAYINESENIKFNNPPNLREAIEILDLKYYKPRADIISIDNITQHPVLKWYVKNNRQS